MNTHIEAILEYPKITRSSPIALRQFMDTVYVSHNCRALLDSGSQTNLITAELCNKLKLQKQRINGTITGVTQNALKICEKNGNKN